MRRSAALLALLAAGCASGARSSAPIVQEPAAPAEITADELRRDLAIFASDSMRGRATGTPDELRGARYVAARLAQLGLEPAGDSGFFQPFPLATRESFVDARFRVIAAGDTTNIPIGEQLVPLTRLGMNAPLPRLTADGPLVFGGYGVELPGRDDLAGLDIAGKVVVVVNGAPASADSATRARLESRTSIGERLGRLIPKAPAGIIILLTGSEGEEFRAAMPSLLESYGPSQPEPDSARVLPMILLGTVRAGSLLLPADWPRNDRARPLGDRRFSGSTRLRHTAINGYNVVAVARGRDSTLNGTYVAYGAHLDHIGIQPPLRDSVTQELDSIANGADDDGSGTVGLLAVASRFMQARPRRSVLFVWHGGEEEGLLGSAYFTANPTIPLDSVVAQLNADMIGRNAPDSIYIVGPSAAPNGQSRVLGEVIDSVNGALPRPFQFNRTWDDPGHPEQIYFRSDHYNYARQGVPVVFFTTGLHEDYHKVTDEVEKIDFDKLARVSRLMYESGRAIANRPTRPIAATPAVP
jgi:hypothetical protein